MHPKSLPSFAPLLFPILLFFITISCEEVCDECETWSFGEVKNIQHPFWFCQEQPPGLPGVQVECKDNRLLVLVNSFEKSYSILQIFYNNRSLWVNSTKLAADDCPVPSDNYLSNSTANGELFLFHHCSGTRPQNSTSMECAHDDVYDKFGGNYSDFPTSNRSCGCEVMAAPVLTLGGEEESPDWCEDIPKNGFLVGWWDDKERCGNCTRKGEKCGSDHETGKFVCRPPQRPDYPSSCGKC
ncbi:unnamed protein product [Musa acuminata subsp. burmannicoides]